MGCPGEQDHDHVSLQQPNEPAALVLPRQHRLTSRNRVPEKLETLADHLLRRRLTLKLLQRQVAKQIGVDKTSFHNWGTNRRKPDLKFMPAIIRFLGYNPLPPPDCWAERLVRVGSSSGFRRKKRPGRSAWIRERWPGGNEVSGSRRVGSRCGLSTS